jgi:hypothetical protein
MSVTRNRKSGAKNRIAPKRFTNGRAHNARRKRSAMFIPMRFTWSISGGWGKQVTHSRKTI